MKKITSVFVLAIASVCQLRPGSEPPSAPVGLLEKNTVFAVYGRGFGIAPILGHLGTYKDVEEMAADTQGWLPKIAPANDGKPVITGIDLIYALAVPCKGTVNCLYYLDQGSGDIVEKYIKPAAERGWIVILETQLGRSDPAAQVQRMIDRGYLKYDNVHVAIDPEFHVVAGHDDPGIPIGTITASQVNQVQDMLNRCVEAGNLKTKKILVVHQFGDAAVHDGVPFMIGDKKDLKNFDNVELVIDGDGLGTPAEKVRKYNLMTDSKTYPAVRFRGMKVFYPNQWEHAGHFDKPPLTLDQVFGLAPVPGGLRMANKPNLLIIA